MKRRGEEPLNIRKRVHVTSDTPVLAVSDDGYVQIAIRGEMEFNDMLVLGMSLCLRDDTWKKKLLARVRKEFEGKDDVWKKVERVMELSKQK